MSLRAPSGERLYDSRELADRDKAQLADRARYPRSYINLGSSVTPTEVLELRVSWFEQLPPKIDQWDVIKVQTGAQTMHRLLQKRKTLDQQVAGISASKPHFYQELSIETPLNNAKDTDGEIAALDAEMRQFVTTANKKYA